MADQNDLNKPDVNSNYSSQVLQTLLGHIVRLWKQDYRGMAHLVPGLRRIATKTVKGKKHIEIYQSGTGTAESKVFDSVDIVPTEISDINHLSERLRDTNKFGHYTIKEESGKLRIYYQNNLIFEMDSTGNIKAEQDITAKKTL